jgi:multicomponent Na+:H+ antiporter subunit A
VSTVLIVLGVTALLSPIVARLHRVGAVLLAIPPLFGFGWFSQQIMAGTPAEGVSRRTTWVEPLGIDFALHLDGLSAFFAVLILGIGTLIVLYAGWYLQGDERLGRFYLVLFAFMASMLGVVIADDAMTLFVFWEGTSLTSYLLIGFDNEEASSRVAARKALLVTGSGGLALLGGLILVHHITGTWALSEWTAAPEVILEHPLSGWALGLIVLGAFTKSAQVPFHFWLPAAMAGPTPVSAYLHSATMVKAGVFLLARLSPIWAATPAWTYVLVGFGAATMLFSAWAALRYTDLKSVLAHTTTMALGLLVMLLGFGDEYSVQAAMAYLLVHALYKGTLFMVAGSVDHGTGTRDLDRLSGLGPKLKITTAAAGLACLSMAGLPPFIGFVGKELAYEANLHAHGLGLFVLGVSVLANAALFGVSLLLFLGPFFGEKSEAASHAHEDPGLASPPLVLATLGLLYGLAPGRLDGLVEPAASAVLGGSTHVHLALWHGLNPAFVASLVTYGLGVGVYLLARRLRTAPSFGAAVAGFADAPARAFEKGVLGLSVGARILVSSIYVGKLRRYVLVVVGTALAGLLLVGTTHEGLAWPKLEQIYAHEVALLAILVTSSAIAAFAEPAMKAIIAVGISGYCVALIYLLFGAPDVAMTQFSIETLTVILVVLTLLHLPGAGFERPRPYSALRDFLVSLATGGAISAVLLSVLSGPLPDRISDWYLHHSYPDAHGRNIVNVILVDFRGFDTWGEITVLTIAGLGVYALLRRRARGGRSASMVGARKEAP